LPDVSLTLVDEVSAADAALVFGGDGTVHRHLPELHATQTPLLVVPSGSGNDFARALGLRSRADALAAWRKFLAGEVRPRAIDLGVVTSAAQPDATHLFCCVGGAGLDAEANRLANAMPRWLRARGGYLLAVALAF